MRAGTAVLLCILFASCALARDKVRLDSKQIDAAKHVEDIVAARFEERFRELGLKPPRRARNELEYRQTLCTATLKGNTAIRRSGSGLPWIWSGETYVTDTPEVLPESVRNGIEQTFRKPGRREYQRYSVTAFPSLNEKEKGKFYVRIDLRYSAGTEFFEDTFTDEMMYKNQWKKSVDPACSEIK